MTSMLQSNVFQNSLDMEGKETKEHFLKLREIRKLIVCAQLCWFSFCMCFDVIVVVLALKG